MERMGLKAMDGSVGIQVNGNLIAGPSSKEIAGIIHSLYELNFPRLVEEASKKAQENVLEFSKEFLTEIKNDVSSIQERLKEPNAQFLLNASVQQAALLGVNGNLNLLSKALKNALLIDDINDFSSISALSLSLIPKLKRRELLSILVSFLVHSFGFRFSNVQLIDNALQICLKNYTELGDVSQTQLHHMVSLGLFSFNSLLSDKCILLLSRRYSNIPNFIDQVNNGNFSSINFVINYYDRNSLVHFHPLPVANVIGFLLLKENIPALDIKLLLQ